MNVILISWQLSGPSWSPSLLATQGCRGTTSTSPCSTKSSKRFSSFWPGQSFKLKSSFTPHETWIWRSGWPQTNYFKRQKAYQWSTFSSTVLSTIFPCPQSSQFYYLEESARRSPLYSSKWSLKSPSFQVLLLRPGFCSRLLHHAASRHVRQWRPRRRQERDRLL